MDTTLILHHPPLAATIERRIEVTKREKTKEKAILTAKMAQATKATPIARKVLKEITIKTI